MSDLRQQVVRQSPATLWHAVRDATARRGLSRFANGLGLSRFGQQNVRQGLNAGSFEHFAVSVHCLLIVDFSLPLLPVLAGDPRKRYPPGRASSGLNLLQNRGGVSYHN